METLRFLAEGLRTTMVWYGVMDADVLGAHDVPDEPPAAMVCAEVRVIEREATAPTWTLAVIHVSSITQFP